MPVQDNQIDELVNELRHNSGIREVRKVNGNTVRFDVPNSTYGRLDLPEYPHWYVDTMTLYTDTVRVHMTYVR